MAPGFQGVVHAVTSLDASRAGPADLAGIARGQWGIESVHWLRDTAYREDSDTGYTGNGSDHGHPQEHSVSALLAGVTEILRTSRPSDVTVPQ